VVQGPGLGGGVKPGWYSKSYLYHMLEVVGDILIVEDMLFVHYTTLCNNEIVIAYTLTGQYVDATIATLPSE